MIRRWHRHQTASAQMIHIVADCLVPGAGPGRQRRGLSGRSPHSSESCVLANRYWAKAQRPATFLGDHRARRYARSRSATAPALQGGSAD